MSDMCNVCSNLIYQPDRPQSGARLLRLPPLPFQLDTVKLAKVKASSCQGCATCKFMLQVISHFDLQLKEDESFSIRTQKTGGNLLEFSDCTIQVYTPCSEPYFVVA